MEGLFFMKKINNFTVEKIKKLSENLIKIYVEVDSEKQTYEIKFENSSIGFLTMPPRDLEFLFRANDVALSKNLINFLKDFVNKKEISLPFEVYSEIAEPQPRQPQVA